MGKNLFGKKVLNLLIFLANLIEVQTPIIFVARKV